MVMMMFEVSIFKEIILLQKITAKIKIAFTSDYLKNVVTYQLLSINNLFAVE